ncbi:MAG: hypothetical protein AAF236_07835 [Verrucomicrobiota bacterium]
MILLFRQLALIVFALSSSGLALAQETESLPVPEAEEEVDWLEHYYKSPSPDRVVAQIKDYAAEGVLEQEGAKPALIAFLAQIIRQNRADLATWYNDLQGLSPEQLQVFHTAMLFSRTDEADQIMRERFGKQYDEQKQITPKILELPLDQRMTTDMLWGFYYATGSKNAVRRIVTCFRFVNAPDNPEGVDVPEGYVPIYKQLPAFAFDSLIANGERHPLVVEHLQTLLAEDETLIAPEREGIEAILEELGVESGTP